MKRHSFQHGSIVLTPRAKGPDVWVLRFRGKGKQPAMRLGTVEELPSKADAQRKAMNFLPSINGQHPACVTVGHLCDRYEFEGMPERESTSGPYRSFLKRIRQDWGNARLDDFVKDVSAIELWLKDLKKMPPKNRPDAVMGPIAKSSKKHIKAFLHRMVECAMRWNLIEIGRNLISLAEIKGSNKRVRPLVILEVSTFWKLVGALEEGERVYVMVHVTMFLGLRGSEMLGLRPDEDFDFDNLTVHIQRGSVGKFQSDTKTEASDEYLPMHPALAIILQTWIAKNPPVNGWLFGNPATGRPYHLDSLRDDHLKPAAKSCGIPTAGFGWHSLRHTYRAMLRDLDDVPLEVQQKLMRHADIKTTTEYGGSLAVSKLRPANARVVSILQGRAA